ncbi:MAG: DUF4238 domain-containing protein [Candidatus Omnitrophica bacterium]|nr:DUF4238 domain-containing protein [Candidatus Omnitrophota bacterium]
MTEHKKQHYIPQCYLEAWCDPECPTGHTPYVWRFSKDGTRIKKKAPENIFYEKDMYTIHLEDGTRDLTLEHGLNQLESLFTQVRKKIEKKENLTIEDRTILCAFSSAMFGRTKAQREHQRKQWEKPLEIMEDMMKATPEQKRRMAALPSSSSTKEAGLSYEDVKYLVKNPTQTFLPSIVRTMTPLLCKIDLAILTSESRIGFITSDAPCVWFDPQAYKRPPFLRHAGLMYESIEISLPISPRALLLLNRKGFNGYYVSNDKADDEANQLRRFYSEEYFVVNRNYKKDIWFDSGA